ncbi:MAG: hypothetical protein KDI06_15580 [Calditrichaeota bacterium]|nr:hypothetical protein [Calditrichota bacterium]
MINNQVNHGKISVDKITLSLDSLDVAHQSELEITKMTKHGSRLSTPSGVELFKDSQGKSIFGKGAYYNSDDNTLTLEIKPPRNPTGLRGFLGRYVRFSLPRRKYGRNVGYCTGKDLDNEIKRAEAELSKAGIFVNLMDAEVCGIEFFVDTVLDHKIPNYVVTLLDFRCNLLEYEAKIRTPDGKWLKVVIVVYYKWVEMSDKGVPNEDIPREMVRFEIRIKSRKKVRKFFGTLTARDLADNYTDITNAMEGCLVAIDPYNPHSIKLPGKKTLKQAFQMFRAQVPSNTNDWFLKVMGWWASKEKGFTVDGVIEIMGYNPKTPAFRSAKKTLMYTIEKANIFGKILKKVGGIKYYSLAEELIRKVPFFRAP